MTRARYESLQQLYKPQMFLIYTEDDVFIHLYENTCKIMEFHVDFAIVS